MSSIALFNKIMATNLLVSMSGVIPSCSSFQFILCSRVEAFSLSLQGEGHSHREIDALLRLICHISGLLIQKQYQSLVPGPYTSPLSKYFYPKVEGNVFTLQHHHLLAQSSHPDIACYTQTLSILCPSSLLSGPHGPGAPSLNNALSEARKSQLDQEPDDPPLQATGTPLRRSLLLHVAIALVVLACVWAGCYGYLMTDVK